MIYWKATKLNRKKKKNKGKLWDFLDNIFKKSTLYGVPEGKQKEAENLFEEITVENFPNLEKKDF